MTTDTDRSSVLVLGGTGKTGRRVAAGLRAAGVDVRTAARAGADVPFDWDDPATHAAALDGVDRLYLVPPTERLDYAELVVRFVDRAVAAGVRHVTHLSARGVDQAPPEVPPRAVELALAERSELTHAVLRPGWFLQNFHEWVFLPVGGVVAAPTGDGAEAFVHAQDIADVAVATLLAPRDHDGAGYRLSGPEALTFADVADRIAKATGRPVGHADVSRREWVARMVADGMPEAYAELLAGLLDEVVRSGQGADVSDDVERVTGHPARSFDDYAAEAAPLAAWSAAV